MLLGTALLIFGAIIGYWLYDERNRVEAQERDRLQVQARVIDVNLGHQLEGANNALAAVRDDFPLSDGKITALGVSRHLKALSDAMAGVRTMFLVDAEGMVVAANRDELIGLNASEREYFKVPRVRPDPAMLYVSRPFRTTLGVFSINLVRVVTGSKGEFAGIVSATLDPEYFNILLSSVLYAPDMWVSIAHGDGVGFLYMPPHEQAAGMDLAKPGSFFSRHRDSGQTATVMTGTGYATGEEHMMAVRTIKPANVPMDKPLIVGVSRDLSAIYARWRRDALMNGALYGVISLASILGLIFVQRRQIAYKGVEERYLTSRRRTDAALRKSEERYRGLVETSHDLIWRCDTEGRFVFLNKAWESTLGYTREEMLGRPFTDFQSPSAAARTLEEFARFPAGGSVIDYETVYISKSGEDVALSFNVIPWREGEMSLEGAQGTASNVTERKRADEALRNSSMRLRELSQRLIESEDSVRRTINRELHDRVGAHLSALNLSLSILRSQLPQESLRAAGARLDDTQKLLEETTTQVRDLMADLHPPALDDYGLFAALRNYVHELGARTAVPISVGGEDLVPRLPLAAETALFRVAQGALTNTVTHAQARRIQVLLAESPDRIALTIADDGVGFDVAHASLAHASWGLAIMRERAQAVGAELNVESTPGEGTRVRVEIRREKR
jgi:PAS domain S-box-containing protein